METKYLETVRDFILRFENSNNKAKRITMVLTMEQHISSLNEITQKILLDDCPIRFLMQKNWIEQRVNKMLKHLQQLFSDEKRNEWNEFLNESIELLSC